MAAVIDKVAWVYTENGMVLSTRSHGKDAYYLPGGKREPGESDLDTLSREIAEELTVAIVRDSAAFLDVFEAQAHGHPVDVIVRMTCYTAEYEGVLAPDSEIAELAWLTHADRHRTSPVDQIIFDRLQADGLLR